MDGIGDIMQSKLVSKPGETRIWIAVLETGEEAKQSLLSLAKKEGVAAASFVALGAFKKAVVGYFDWQTKKYQPIPIGEQVEVITLVGDIVPDEKGKPSLHAHTVLGRSDGSTRGGHLIEGHVRPTLEITITETPAHLTRRKHPDLGVALIETD
jgi:predicted DNA-binding protein with PD1-like motif